MEEARRPGSYVPANLDFPIALHSPEGEVGELWPSCLEKDNGSGKAIKTEKGSSAERVRVKLPSLAALDNEKLCWEDRAGQTP